MEPYDQDTQKILVVEDDRALRTILADRLRTENYEVFEAADGEEGLEMAKNQKPDLVMLDIIMPKVDGMEMLRQLRQDPWGKEANVMMLTNLSTEDQKNTANELGAQDYLVKADLDIEGIVSNVKNRIATGPSESGENMINL